MIYKVYFADGGVAKTGLTATWEYLKKVSDGSNYTPQPSFTEIGGGWYKFSLSPAEDLAGSIDGGGALADIDRYVPADMTPYDSLLDSIIEGTITFKQVMMLILAAFGGKTSGGATSNVIYRNPADTEDRISMTVDEKGNRTSVTLDLT